MKFSLEECTKGILKRRKLIKSNDITRNKVNEIDEFDQTLTYKYLRIDGLHTVRRILRRLRREGPS